MPGGLPDRSRCGGAGNPGRSDGRRRPSCRVQVVPRCWPRRRDAFTSGMHGVGIVGAAVMLLAAVGCLGTLRRAKVAVAA